MNNEEKDPRDLEGREIISRFIEVLEVPNNVFCKEECILCRRFFDADLTLFYLASFGYICPECFGSLTFIENENNKI